MTTVDLDRLVADPPRIHAEGDWSLAPDALRFLASAVTPGDRTLETGIGTSTALFAQLGCDHVTITPDAAEVRRFRAWASSHDIQLDRVSFVEGTSQDVLPGLDPGPLDVVLIDGSHAFPVPFLDWYYTARHLRDSGLLVVDDTQVWTGRVLRDVLDADPGWRREATPDRAAVFRRSGPFVPRVSWVDQPYVTARSLVWREDAWRPYHPDRPYVIEHPRSPTSIVLNTPHAPP